MDWIDRISSAPSIHSNAERRSENEMLPLPTFPKLVGDPYQLQFSDNFGKVTIEKRVLNPVGMADRSHGIHPVDGKQQRNQVPLGMTRLKSCFTHQILDRFKTNFMPSQKAFFSFNALHPRLKSRATLCRPYRDLCRPNFPNLAEIPFQLGFQSNFEKVAGGKFE